MKIVRKILSIVNLIAIFITTLAVQSTKWVKETYGDITFDEILFTLTAPIRGTEDSLIESFKNDALKPAIIYSLLIFVAVTALYWFFFNSNFRISFEAFKSKKRTIRINGIIPFVLFLILNIGTIAMHLNHCLDVTGIKDYYFNQAINSTFIEENYVDPDNVALTFPKKKRNLIHIYVESFESSFFSEELGGLEEDNLLEELTSLTSDNVNFSDNDLFGGAYQVYGTTFTSAGLTAQMLGIPTKLSNNFIGLTENRDGFLNGATGLGNILKENGYKQFFIMGSDKVFGNRDILLEKHGNYEIYDLAKAKEEGALPSDYMVFWGFEDGKLFDFAKEQLEDISKDNSPFNYSILTENTHAQDGYIEESCAIKYSEHYSNAVSCSASQIADFINWAKQQKFYEDTTIIITGDHLSMSAKHFSEEDYSKRRIYNLFINAAAKPVKTKNRKFTTLDIFPTTLAALGVKIDGDRLALGTNLFSDKQTLLEQYGIETINTEFEKRSRFYNSNFLIDKKR